ncbi:MAG: DUF2007 domain-containing protein [Paludibacter sp.]|nr:DUF2007 domain-containing protein [Paludibacter sp.]
MEDQIITLKTYESTVDAMVDQEILRANDIECFINNDQLVELYPMFKAIDEGLKIVVFEKDFDRALKILADLRQETSTPEIQPEKQDIERIAENHYLYSFSDKDIIDVIANPSDWTKEEQSIANEIINKRGLTVTMEALRLAHLRKTEQEKLETKQANKVSNNSYVWFYIIGILSMLNTVLLAMHTSYRFIFGLGITQMIDTFTFLISDNYKTIAFFLSFIISGIFIILGYQARQKKQGAFLGGLILYGLDSIIYIAAMDLMSSAFHLFVFIILIRGYIKLTAEKKESTSA